MQSVLDKAVEAYRRQRFLDALHGDFLTLREDPAAWDEEKQERREWDHTFGDGRISEGDE